MYVYIYIYTYPDTPSRGSRRRPKAEARACKSGFPNAKSSSTHLSSRHWNSIEANHYDDPTTNSLIYWGNLASNLGCITHANMLYIDYLL